MYRNILLSIAVLLSYLSSGCVVNPITGEEQFMLISAQQELAIGKNYAPEIEKEMGGKIDNEQLQKYIDHVGRKIAKISHKPNMEYHFTALNDETTNAFALPGGYVFITRGMLEKLQTEAQLAAILAHETIHIVARHSSAAMSREIGIDLLLSVVTSDKTSQGVKMATGLTRQIIGLRYSREHEKEADLAGLSYLIKAGYNPYGMAETMQILQDEQKSRQVEFLSSHPSPGNRKDYITRRIQRRYTNLTDARIGREDYQKSVLQQIVSLPRKE